MPYDTLPPAAAHRVELDGRERLIVSGVDDVCLLYTSDAADD